MMKQIIAFSLALLFLAACEQDELPLLPPAVNQTTPIDTSGGDHVIARGVTLTNSVNMESDYKQQVWFDLGSNSVVKTNLRTDWDLAFDCDGNANIVYLNAALNASVAFTKETDFNAVTSDAGLTYTYEHQSGSSDNYAIGDVTNQRNVFIIDRGFDPAGNLLGKWKAQITLVQNGDYYLTCSQLNGNHLTTAIISKDPLYNRVAFSFNTGNPIQIEPPKTDYDIVFTQYTHVFENPPLPYSVNGVLINSYWTEAAEEFDMDFQNISRAHADSLFFSEHWDVIGYDWKSFDLQSGTFTVYPDRNYLIKDAFGYVYKLHFLDFYDDFGVKGTASFELERL